MTAFVLFTNTAISQGSKQDQIKALSNEAANYFLQCIKHVDGNDDSVIVFSKKAILKFLSIYSLDTTSKSVGDYLADCYRYNRKYDSAIFWYRHQLKINKDSAAISAVSEFIALSFIANGYLDSSIQYLNMAITNTPKIFENTLLFSSIVNFANKLYNGTDSISMASLKYKMIKPCNYSIEILKSLLPYSDSDKAYYPYKKIKALIREREKNCH
jgi:tetratricopeptide (TPR) repeat protein